MNQDIYNKEVSHLKEKINSCKENILNDAIKMENTFHFNQFYNQLEDIKKEYNQIYNSISNPVSQSRLLAYLQEETDFIVLLSDLLNHLAHYHTVIGPFVDKYEMQREWKDIRTIIKYKDAYQQMDIEFTKNAENNKNMYNAFLKNEDSLVLFDTLNEKIRTSEKEMDDAINRIEERGSADTKVTETPKEIYQESTKKIVERLGKEAIESLDRFCEKLDWEYEEEIRKDFTEKEELEATDLLIKENDLKIDEEYLKTLSLPFQIEYLKSIIANIEKLPGKKTTAKYKTTKVRIAKKYFSRWIYCQTKLSEVTRQYEEELEMMNEKVQKQEKEEYANLYLQFKDAEKELFLLAHNAKEYANTNQVVAVASFNGEPLYVLKNNLARFNKIFVDYKNLQHDIKEFAIEHNMDVIENAEKLETLESLEKNLYEQIYFLKNQGEQTNEVLEKIYTLKSQLYKINKGKKFSLLANLKVMFNTFPLVGDLKEALTEIAESPEAFLESREHALDEKKQILNDILNKMKEYKNNVYDKMNNDIKNNIGQVKEVKDSAKSETEKKKPKDILEKQMVKIKRCLHLLPTNIKKVIPIKNIKEPIDKKVLASRVVSVSILAAITVGIAALSSNDPVINENQELKVETVTDDVSLRVNLEKKEILSDYSSILKKSLFSDNVNSYDEKSSIYDLKDFFAESSATTSNALIYQKDSTKEDKTESISVAHKEVTDLEQEKENVDNEETNDTYSYLDVLENEYHDFGDQFIANDDAVVYETSEDASKKENPKSTYFENGSIRTIDGISYEYNGEIIFISAQDPDAEAKKAALQANGAKEVNFRAINENSSTNGWEGFFVDENVTFTIDGRGSR